MELYSVGGVDLSHMIVSFVVVNMVFVWRMQKDSHLKAFLPIIRDKEFYPVIYDAQDVVLSLPPIINGDHSKITLNTRNVFIECTATDLRKAEIVLDTMCTMFAEYCEAKFEVEAVRVKQLDGSVHVYPKLSERSELIAVDEVNRKLGLSVTGAEMTRLLNKMGLMATATSERADQLEVRIPPTRSDVLHMCDIVEDVAIGYGYNNLTKTIPKSNCFSSEVRQRFSIWDHQMLVFRNSFFFLWLKVRVEQVQRLVALWVGSVRLHRGTYLHSRKRSWTCQKRFVDCYFRSVFFIFFCYYPTQCSKEDIADRLGKKIESIPAVHISNPKTCDFQVVRTTLLPGLLKTIASSRNMPLPLKIFEVSDVVLSDKESGTRNSSLDSCVLLSWLVISHSFIVEVGARNERRLAVVFYNKLAGFEIVHGVLDRIMQVLNVQWKTGYHLEHTDGKLDRTNWLFDWVSSEAFCSIANAACRFDLHARPMRYSYFARTQHRLTRRLASRCHPELRAQPAVLCSRAQHWTLPIVYKQKRSTHLAKQPVSLWIIKVKKQNTVWFKRKM